MVVGTEARSRSALSVDGGPDILYLKRGAAGSEHVSPRRGLHCTSYLVEFALPLAVPWHSTWHGRPGVSWDADAAGGSRWAPWLEAAAVDVWRAAGAR